jgi:type II secretory pathway component PulJ
MKRSRKSRVHGGTAGRPGGFTLLELLSAVTLLVVLGTLLFEVFDQASQVIRMGNARQEIYQYARVLYETLERELEGNFSQREAALSVASSGLTRPFRVYTSSQMMPKFDRPVRQGSDALSFTSALVGRDTLETSATYGQTANTAHVAYWLGPDNCILSRYESYDLTGSASGRGWEFALNVLEFRIQCFDQWNSPCGFQRMDWESASTVPSGARRGLPDAVLITIKLTDRDHVGMYELDPSTNVEPSAKLSRLKSGFSAEDDPLAQEFRQIVRTKEMR